MRTLSDHDELGKSLQGSKFLSHVTLDCARLFNDLLPSTPDVINIGSPTTYLNAVYARNIDSEINTNSLSITSLTNTVNTNFNNVYETFNIVNETLTSIYETLSTTINNIVEVMTSGGLITACEAPLDYNSTLGSYVLNVGKGLEITDGSIRTDDTFNRTAGALTIRKGWVIYQISVLLTSSIWGSM